MASFGRRPAVRGLLHRLSPWSAAGGAALLAVAYTLAYLGDRALPGNWRLYPEGWWGWFDQSRTLASTLAFAAGDLDPGKHWYPLGYSLLGTPFARIAPNHPYFLVGLASLLVAFHAFLAVAGRLHIPAAVGVLLFLGAAMSDPVLFRGWVVPWNTTPTAALIWALIAASAAYLQGVRRPYLIGLCAAGIGACRPTDLLLTVPCFVAVTWSAVHLPRVGGVEHRREHCGPVPPGEAPVSLGHRPCAPTSTANGGLRLASEAGWVLAGVATIAVPYAVLHLAIYGPAPSPYMLLVRQIGFTLHDFGWKVYVLLVDPSAWFQDGVGMLRRFPWLLLGLAGVVPALLRGPIERVLAATLAVHATLYFSYVDLIPTGLWRFLNIHYFVWAMPGFGLLLALLLWDLALPVRRSLRRVAVASLVGTFLLSCIQVEPVPVAAQAPAKAIDFAGPTPPFTETYFAILSVRDARGTLANTLDMRIFPIRDGLRLIGLARAIEGPVIWETKGAPPLPADAAQTRYGIAVHFGWPRWLRKSPWKSVLPG